MSRHSQFTPVLLAANDQYGVLAAVRALRAAGYAPWLGVSESGTYAGLSRAAVGVVPIPNPALDSEGFVRELAAATVQLSAVAVLPSADPHFLALAGREADFLGTAFGVPSHESVERATNKELLPELAATAGLWMPPTRKLTRSDEEAVGASGLPAIVKPLRSWIRNSDGTVSVYEARRVSTEQEIEEALETFPRREGLIQPYIPGPNVSVSGVSWEGKLICALHHLSERIWPMPVGVTAYAKTIPPNAELEQGVSRLLRAIGWSGLFEVEFKRSLSGEHYMIDLNPRIYGSLALATAAGLNLPAIWVDLLLGRRPDIHGYRVGTRFRQEVWDTCALVQMLMNGEHRHVLQGLTPRRGTTHAIFSLHDPMPLLAPGVLLLKWLRRRTARSFLRAPVKPQI